MKSFDWRWIVLVPALGIASGGCVVKSGDDDDDDCTDSDGDGICNADDCAPADPTNDCEPCDDSDGDGICDEVDCAPEDPTNDSCACDDADGDGNCDDEDCFPDDPLYWECDCVDTDFDGTCDDDDCYPDDWRIWDCKCDDIDGDGVCDEDDVSECIDDLTGEYICEEACTEADNSCTDPWQINYCVGGNWYTTDCNDSCATDPKVYEPTCGAPAIMGECSDGLGACVCWCEDSFDTCVDDWTVRYTREGTTYEVQCWQYCGGTCDADAGACACP